MAGTCTSVCDNDPCLSSVRLEGFLWDADGHNQAKLHEDRHSLGFVKTQARKKPSQLTIAKPNSSCTPSGTAITDKPNSLHMSYHWGCHVDQVIRLSLPRPRKHGTEIYNKQKAEGKPRNPTQSASLNDQPREGTSIGLSPYTPAGPNSIPFMPKNLPYPSMELKKKIARGSRESETEATPEVNPEWRNP